jgi:hypothetical protein
VFVSQFLNQLLVCIMMYLPSIAVNGWKKTEGTGYYSRLFLECLPSCRSVSSVILCAALILTAGGLMSE